MTVDENVLVRSQGISTITYGIRCSVPHTTRIYPTQSKICGNGKMFMSQSLIKTSFLPFVQGVFFTGTPLKVWKT